MRRALSLAFAAITSCTPGAYTSVRLLSDGTYLLTRVESGIAGSTRASLLRCRLEGERLRCAEVARP